MLTVGTAAPDVILHFHDGSTTRLSVFRGVYNVVLYFYPRDFTWGCTRQACSFADHYNRITALGAVLIGVSADSPEQHRRFVDGYDLPFRLATDRDSSVSKAYEVHVLGGLRQLRVTYVIDKKGWIRGVIHREIRVLRHATDVLKILQSLGQQP
ncbi:MAG: peroxiredoxin [Ignavibacteriales bacterium]|nr:peroxiredoxin [Ignavibacteriales bacterium]